MSVKEYKDGDVVLARHIPGSVAWQKPLQFSQDADFIEVGTGLRCGQRAFGAYAQDRAANIRVDTGSAVICKGSIKAHVHNRQLEKSWGLSRTKAISW